MIFPYYFSSAFLATVIHTALPAAHHEEVCKVSSSVGRIYVQPIYAKTFFIESDFSKHSIFNDAN